MEKTQLDGMADHIVIGAAHPWLVRNDLAIAQTIAFLRNRTAHPIVSATRPIALRSINSRIARA